VVEQVFVGGVEGLQRVVVLLGLADQIELSEGAGEQGPGGRKLWVIEPLG